MSKRKQYPKAENALKSSCNTMAKTFELQFNASGSQIDFENGVIRGVSLITSGIEVQGHSCFADDLTNETVLSACLKLGRLKCKINHSTDATSIVGHLQDFSIVGDKVVADLVLLKSSQYYNYILELAKELSSSFGLSISFKPKMEKKNGKEFVRCSEIYSCDIVDQPAGNPDGLFENKNMKPKDLDVATANVVNTSTPIIAQATDAQNDEIKDKNVGVICPTCESTTNVLSKLNDLHSAAANKIDDYLQHIESNDNDLVSKISGLKDSLSASDTKIVALEAKLTEFESSLTEKNQLLFSMLEIFESRTDEFVSEFNEKFSKSKKLNKALESKVEELSTKLDGKVAWLTSAISEKEEQFDTKLAAQKKEFGNASVIARKMLASTGVPLKRIPDADTSTSVVSFIDRLNAIADPVIHNQFYKKYETEIKAEYQQRINREKLMQT